MAGFMTKFQGAELYEGEFPAGADLENGTLVELDATGKKWVLATETTAAFLCKEKTDAYGVAAYRFQAVKDMPDVGFVESEEDINDSFAYDTATYTTKTGELVRVHPLVKGDEFITSKVNGDLAVGTGYAVSNGILG